MAAGNNTEKKSKPVAFTGEAVSVERVVPGGKGVYRRLRVVDGIVVEVIANREEQIDVARERARVGILDMSLPPRRITYTPADHSRE